MPRTYNHSSKLIRRSSSPTGSPRTPSQPSHCPGGRTPSLWHKPQPSNPPPTKHGCCGLASPLPRRSRLVPPKYLQIPTTYSGTTHAENLPSWTSNPATSHPGRREVAATSLHACFLDQATIEQSVTSLRRATANLAHHAFLVTALESSSAAALRNIVTVADWLAENEPQVVTMIITGPSDTISDIVASSGAEGASLLDIDFWNWEG